ncbi:MAG: DUF1569 domain-containing protein [Bacteroidota bacterium]
MALPNIFSEKVASEVIGRINTLSPEDNPQWGKMNVSQMLAHCNVPYEMVFENKNPKPNPILKFIIQLMAKETVTGEKPYKRSTATAPAFKIQGDRDFEAEKSRLINYINKTRELGEAEFDGKESHSFGKLNIDQWNNMFYKHLDHHLGQFGR